MADDAPKLKSGTFTVRNTAPGTRGFYDHTGALRELPAGKSTSGVRFTEAEHASASAAGYFELTAGDAPADAETDASDADGLPETKAELEALATAEGVDLDAIEGSGKNGNVVKADIVAAIEAKRADAAPAAPVDNSQPGDTLDKMSDTDLRETVTALTGEEPPADADRPTLLALARGEA